MAVEREGSAEKWGDGIAKRQAGTCGGEGVFIIVIMVVICGYICVSKLLRFYT